MAWFRVDDKMHSHTKPRAAGLAAMGLWCMAGSYCGDHLTDGFVPDWYVKTWPKGASLALKLVSAGLWERADKGYRFLSWEEYQLTAAEEEEQSRKRRAKATLNAHKRWHVGRGEVAEGCQFCDTQAMHRA